MTARPLDQQTVLVTGAAQGLGLAVARAFAARGSRLILLDLQAEPLEKVCRELGPNASGHAVDLTDAVALQQLLGRVDVGSVDTLVHNAGILTVVPFEDMDLSRWLATVNVGLEAAFLLTRAVWDGMRARGAGSIVYVSSRSGIVGFLHETAYCTSKHGLEGLVKALHMEAAAHGIWVNTITPGMFMHTPMSERNYNDDLKSKWVDPIELTPAFVYLAEHHDESLAGQRISAWDLSQSVRAGTASYSASTTSGVGRVKNSSSLERPRHISTAK